MLTKLKKKVQQWLSLEAKIAHRMGLTPNIISGIGFTLSILAAVAYIFVPNELAFLLIAVLLLLASGFCDMLDGILARNYQQVTIFGGFFDSLLDRCSDSIIYSGIIIAGLSNLFSGLAALIGSMLVSYSRARAEATGIRMESVGLAERAERTLILAVASIAAFFWLPFLDWGIFLLAILSNFTVLQRIFYMYKSLRKTENNEESVSSSVS